MAGQFVWGIYDTDDFLRRYSILIQPETLTLVVAGTQNVSNSGSHIGLPRIQSDGSRRRPFPIARQVLFSFVSPAPLGYADGRILKLPWLRAGYLPFFDESTPASYRGFPVKMLKRIPEYRT